MNKKLTELARALITLAIYFLALWLVWWFSNWKVALGMFLFVYANNRSFSDVMASRHGKRKP